MKQTKRRWIAAAAGCTLLLSLALTGCSGAEDEATESAAPVTETAAASGAYLTADDITINETLENSADGEHVITADGEEASYNNIAVNKTGEADGDEADFYGENAAIFATNGATLTLQEILVNTDGTHANGVFSYGEGTTVNISDSVIETSGNCSGGLMTTGGGTMNADNLTIHTTGNSSAAIRSDRGGGTVNVTGGSYTTDGTGSPVIYSTADITVSDAKLVSTASQGVVVEGKNSVTLKNVDLTASNTTKNSDKSDWYQAVMLYQSMSGDADEGVSAFTMEGGSLTNLNGDIFFVNNTVATVTLKASSQTIDGDMLVDEVSNLNLYLADGSSFTGSINPDGEAGEVYVELTGGAKWTLTADSYITSLTCDADSIDLNGHTLYVGGTAYTEGTASTGTPIEVTVSAGGHDGMEPPPDGGMGEPPSGGKGDKPPEKP